MDITNTPAIFNDGEPTMSSREIAELLEKRHDKVKQTIQRLVEKGVINSPPLGEYSSEGAGRPGTEYHLDKRSSLIVVAQLSPEFTARVVDRWQELEQQVAKSVPVDVPGITRADLARMVLESEEEKAALEAKNAEQECLITNLSPKAEAHDRFLDSSGEVNLRQAMREVGRRPNLGIKELRDKGVFFSEGTNNCTPKRQYIERGYFVVRPSKPNREGIVYPQTLVTPRGVAWLDSFVSDELRIGGAA